MARPCGTRDNGPEPEPVSAPPAVPKALFAAGRLVGFTLFAGLAVAVFAGVVLLPAAAQLEQARCERGTTEAELADMESLAAVNDSFIRAMTTDSVVNLRWFSSVTGQLPANEVVFYDPQNPPPPPSQTIRITPHPRPAGPDPRIMRLAERFQQPNTRRGMALVAAICLATAMLLFSPPHKYIRPDA